MKAPIPEPFLSPGRPDSALKIKGPRPRYLLVMIGIGWLINLARAVTPDGDYTFPWSTAAFYAFLIFLDYSLWLGRNWARVVTVVFACLPILFLTVTLQYNGVSLAIEVINSLFSIGYLVYLTRPATVGFYKGRPAEIA